MSFQALGVVAKPPEWKVENVGAGDTHTALSIGGSRSKKAESCIFLSRIGKRALPEAETRPKRGAIGFVPASESGSRSGGFASTCIFTRVNGVLSTL